MLNDFDNMWHEVNYKSNKQLFDELCDAIAKGRKVHEDEIVNKPLEDVYAQEQQDRENEDLRECLLDVFKAFGLPQKPNRLKVLPNGHRNPETCKEGKKKVCSAALHPEFSYPLIDVAEMSIEKGYEPLNWIRSDTKVSLMYLIEAAQRHLDKVKLGIDINTEETGMDGKPTTIQPTHFAQVAYNMLMADLQIRKGVAIDDRLFKDGEPTKK